MPSVRGPDQSKDRWKLTTTSSKVTVAVVVGFITLAVTGILLFLKITRGLRGRRERRRRKDALVKKQGSEEKLSAREQAGRRKGRGRNAFEEDEWEGVPVRWPERPAFEIQADQMSCRRDDRRGRVGQSTPRARHEGLRRTEGLPRPFWGYKSR